VVVDAAQRKTKENEREKLFQGNKDRCAQKELDRADIVRDVRLGDLSGLRHDFSDRMSQLGALLDNSSFLSQHKRHATSRR
jgi:hypothetical protein